MNTNCVDFPQSMTHIACSTVTCLGLLGTQIVNRNARSSCARHPHLGSAIERTRMKLRSCRRSSCLLVAFPSHANTHIVVAIAVYVLCTTKYLRIVCRNATCHVQPIHLQTIIVNSLCDTIARVVPWKESKPVTHITHDYVFSII